MSFLPDEMPGPLAGAEDAQFWSFCNERQLCVQQCANCRTYRHPSSPICPVCRSNDTLWPQASGDGTVFSYTISAHAVHPALKGFGPFNICVILLDGAGDVRLVSNVMDARPEELAIGLRVRLRWDPLADGQVLPRFVVLREEAGHA